MAAKQSLTRSRRVLFYFLAALIPFIFLVIFELTLRLFGYGEDLPLFVEDENQPEYMLMNKDIGLRYFIREQDAPKGQLDFFRKDKSQNSYRIFVQGGSTAAGFPFAHGASFSRILSKKLNSSLKKGFSEVEVVNTGLGAVNSFTLLDFADEIVLQTPDAVLIYAGHNEYYGVLGVGSAQKFGSSPGITRTYLKLRKFRMLQLFRKVYYSLVSKSSSEVISGENATFMAKMVGNQKIILESKEFQKGLDQFRDNMSMLVEKYQEAGIEVYFASVASNLRSQRPFYSEGVFTVNSNDSKSGSGAGAIDYYLKGIEMLENNQTDEAKEAFKTAKNLDELRFRAPEAINEIINDLCETYNLKFVDVEADLSEASEYNIVGNDVMLEHLHPNLKGYSLLAQSFYEAIVRDHPSNFTFDDELTYNHTSVDSIYGNLLVDRLLSGWPFQESIPEEDLVLKNFIANTIPEKLAMAIYSAEITWPDAINQLYAFYMKNGEYKNAAITAEVLAQEFSILPQPKIMLAEAYSMAEMYENSIETYKQAYALNPSSDIAMRIAGIYLYLKQYEKTATQLQVVSSITPEIRNEIEFIAMNDILRYTAELEQGDSSLVAFKNISGAYAYLGNFEESLNMIALAKTKFPDDDQLLQLEKTVLSQTASRVNKIKINQ